MSVAKDKLGDAAKALGREHGVHWADVTVTSDKCTVDAAKRIVSGFEDGDPQVMDLCPNPLSGEWADEPTPMTILDEIANKVDPHELRGEAIEEGDDLIDVYEESFREAFWDKVILASKSIMDGAA